MLSYGVDQNLGLLFFWDSFIFAATKKLLEILGQQIPQAPKRSRAGGVIGGNVGRIELGDGEQNEGGREEREDH